MSKTSLWIIAALVLLTMVLFCRHPRTSTDEVIASMEKAVEESKARTDAIVSETKKKEVNARVQSRKTADRLDGDELCDAINEMLRCYRRGE